MKLSKSEEQLMQYLWSLQRAFMKELLDAYPDPKPKTTTVATLLKRMSDKGFVGYEVFGNSRQYYPLVEKEAYFSTHMQQLIQRFFNNSTAQFASFFTSKIEMTTEELEELRDIIDEQINKQEE